MNKYQVEMVETAVEYAERGWNVFPCTWKKTPATENGFYDATTDEEQIIKWWVDQPKSLIGIRTGKESGFWVVDVDEKNGKSGIVSLKERFGDQFILREEDLLQKTASGGHHFLYEYEHPVSCGTNYLPGIDVRGDGGYIIASPSSLKIGDTFKRYKFNDLTKQPQPAPEWAKQLITIRPSNKQTLDFGDIISNGVPEGARDDSIFRLACMLEREGIDYDTARATISLIAERCNPPFDQVGAAEKVHRAYTDYRSAKGVGTELSAIEKRIAELKEQGQ